MEEILEPDPVVICIAGMPRSGTSLITQLLNRCGVYLGAPEDLMPASRNNTDGFWENLRFVRVNERLLAASDGQWFAPPPKLNATPEIIAEGRSVVANFEGTDPWAFKDPRNAVTIPFWKSLLPSMKVLVCLRHPAESASSLVASTLVPRTFYWTVTRDGSPIRLDDHPSNTLQRLSGLARTATSRPVRSATIRQLGLELWRVYNSRILEQTSATDRLVTHYAAMMTSPRSELARILAWAGIQVSPATIDEAILAVSGRMRHQRNEQTKLESEVADLYDRLCLEASYIDGDGLIQRANTAANISA